MLEPKTIAAGCCTARRVDTVEALDVRLETGMSWSITSMTVHRVLIEDRD
ncbi:MAG: hypothetical protein SH859_14340 [Hyphomicrobium aestuarii]|nr:hypothetical protein [Hyphomicrobium aestuarii]